MTETIVLAVHIMVAFALILIVLLQSGKGANMGAAFGGSSQTVFGSRGPAGFMSKLTTGVAVVFMLTSLTLSMISSEDRQVTIIEDIDIAPQSEVEGFPSVDEAPEEEPSAEAIDPFATPTPLDETATDEDTGTAAGEN